MYMYFDFFMIFFLVIQWICLIIVLFLRKEIEEVNVGLRRIGLEEIEIGGKIYFYYRYLLYYYRLYFEIYMLFCEQ